jgi:hypothetical protein
MLKRTLYEVANYVACSCLLLIIFFLSNYKKYVGHFSLKLGGGDQFGRSDYLHFGIGNFPYCWRIR